MVKLDLAGVPETMLWPLWNRAAEHARTDRLIDDPLSAELVETIDYDFARNFGKPTAFHPIRSRVGDDFLKAFVVRTKGDCNIVALGEGLETQYWRLGSPHLPWYSVDVAEAIEVRRRLLPSAPSIRPVARSALDLGRMDEMSPNKPVFISAMGLLMYFSDAEVRRLLQAIAERFANYEIFFDTITPFMSKKTLTGVKVTKHYTAPPMPWGVTFDQLPDFLRSIEGVAPRKVQTYADPFPERLRLYSVLGQIGPIRRMFAGSLALAGPSPTGEERQI